jgi:hypothetical protein
LLPQGVVPAEEERSPSIAAQAWANTIVLGPRGTQDVITTVS